MKKIKKATKNGLWLIQRIIWRRKKWEKRKRKIEVLEHVWKKQTKTSRKQEKSNLRYVPRKFTTLNRTSNRRNERNPWEDWKVQKASQKIKETNLGKNSEAQTKNS